jgi:gas vesicle protein
MSENDFNAAYPPEGNLGDAGRVPPPKTGGHNVQAHRNDPVSEPFNTGDPIVPPEPLLPPDLGGPSTAGGDARVSGAPVVGAPQPGSTSGKGQEAKEQARELAEDGKESARHVGHAAKREAESILDDAKKQTSNLLDELGSDVKAQTAVAQEKVSTNLRQISDELRSMLQSSDASGTASHLVDQAARYSGDAAQWLGNKEPGDILHEVKDFARRRPGAFLGIALGAGLLAGRITRNAGSGPDASEKSRASSAQIPEMGEPRDVSPLPPTVNQTMGSGAVGGTGVDPGVEYYPPAGRGNGQGFSGS